MKKFARLLCVTLSLILCVSCFSLVACGPNPPDPTTTNDTVIFNSDELDKVFNPFFHTSAADGEITGQTQVSMLTSDGKGKPYCGYNEPTVVLDYNQTITFNDEKYVNSDKSPDLGGNSASDFTGDQYYTTYQFLIKNGIKFSDGEDLTINDVVFNLYAYLDPAYTGSSTIYSTAIKGLQEYRTQQRGATDSDAQSFNQTINNYAQNRLARILSAYHKDANTRTKNRQNEDIIGHKEEILGDVETIRKMFWDEITTDYRNSVANLETYIEENEKLAELPQGSAEWKDKWLNSLEFTEEWEVFLFNEGFINVEYENDGKIAVYEDGETNFGFDKEGNMLEVGDKKIDYGKTGSWWHDQKSLITIVFNEFMGIYERDDQYGNMFEQADKAVSDGEGKPNKPSKPEYGPITDMQVDQYEKASGSNLKIMKDGAVDPQYWELLWSENSRLVGNLPDAITRWATGQNAQDQFVAEERTKWFQENGKVTDNISGIKVIKLHSGDTFNGKMTGEFTLREDYYVLQVDVERVDPQAIWNLSFNVAPMHYYSNADNDSSGKYVRTEGGKKVYDDYRAFHYPIYDSNGDLITEDPMYVNETYPDGKFNEEDKIHVGLPFSDIDYFNNVVKASAIISLPVGAGMYKVGSMNTSDENYAPAQRPKFGDFCYNNIVYFIRNPYFYTASGRGYKSNDEALEQHSGVTNCRIKFIRYQVISASKLLDTILEGTIDYGNPAASIKNIQRINSSKNVEMLKVDNNGYGYIGINPKYVPDLQIRQAIMHAIDTRLIQAYYGDDYAELIYRPCSKTSWAYPDDVTEPYYKYDPDGIEIDKLVTAAGFSGSRGSVYTKQAADGTTRKLDYQFTIAGASEDHPAFSALQAAANLLNQHGFKIVVRTDATALTKLAAGNLAVWAAAWGSGIDPDMYQVYHCDSQATSVRSWGYPQILADSIGEYTEEKNIITGDLKEMIEKARGTFNEEARANYYHQAYNDVMELAVELPTYQRKNVYVYKKNFFKEETLNTNPTVHNGILARLWEVELL